MEPREEIDARLAAALVRQLEREWDHANWARFGERMRRPRIVLHDGGRRLGSWDSAHREMGFSRAMVLEVPWVHVEEVLLHEMAHQYVDEILGVRDETDHGPTFRRVCRERAIDPAATARPAEGEPAVDDPRTARLREKVRRLLALAGSDNQHEAELAMVRARELLARHELELGDEGASRGYVVRRLGRGRRRREAWEAGVGRILEDHFKVRVVHLDDFDPRSGRTVKALEIVGTPANVEMAEYVHAFLVRTVLAIWDARRAALGGRRRAAFLRGVVRGFHEKLDAQAIGAPESPRAADSSALVAVRESARLDGWFRRRHPRLRSVSSSGTAHAGAYHAGRADGRRIVLHRPMGEGGSRGRLLPSGE